MSYIIREVELRSFLSHGNTCMRLSEGSTAIVGNNGAGKTSIFEAINFALTLKPWRGNTADLIHVGGSRFVVRLLLEDPTGALPPAEATITVERRGRTVSTSPVLKVGANVVAPDSGCGAQIAGAKVVATTVKDYKAELARLLNLSGMADYADFLDTAIIVRQGGLSQMASIISQGGKRLKELLETAIGIPAIQELQDRIKSHTVKATRSDGSLVLAVDVGPKKRDRVASELANVSEKRRKLREALRSLEEERAKLEQELKEADSQVTALEQESKEVCSRAASYEATKEELDRIREELDQHEKELAELEKSRSKAQAELDEAIRLEPVARMATRLDELDSLSKLIEDLEERLRPLAEIEALWAKAKGAEEHYRKYMQLSDDLRKLRDEEEKAQSVVSSLEMMARRLDEIMRRASSIAEEVSRLLGVQGASPSEVLVKARESLSSLEAKIKDLREEYERLSVRAAELEKQVKDFKGALELLGSAEGAARCPVCGSPLTAEKLAELRARFSEGLRLAEEELRQVKARRDNMKDEIDKSEALSAKSKMLVSQLEEVLGGISEQLANSRSELEAARKRLEELRRRRQSVETELEALASESSDYVSAINELRRRGLDDERKVAEAIHELEDVKARLKELTSRRDSLVAELLRVTGASDVLQARKIVTEATVKYRAVQYLRAQLEEIDSRREEIQARLARTRDEYAVLESKLKELEGFRARCSELESKLTEARGLRDDVSKRLASVQSRLDQTKAEFERSDDEYNALDRALKKLDVGLGVISLLDRYSKAKYSKALVDLENNMNDVFHRFGLDYDRVDVRVGEESFEFVLVSRQGAERPFSSLSGGEQIAVSLAYVLALNRLLRSRVGFLLLDEPTDMLDDERRRALMEVLGRLAEEGVVRQLIVITHHTDVVDSLDYVCRVVKEGEYSRVACGEEGQA